MSVPVTLALTGDQHDRLKKFLLPGDGNEAAALILCGRRDGDSRHRLTVQKIHEIPYEECSVRTPTLVTWNTDCIVDVLDYAHEQNLSVIKLHSHPNGYEAFSSTDDEGDEVFLPLLREWVEGDLVHGSAVMLPDGQMFGRFLNPDNSFSPIDCISVAGDDLHFWYTDAGSRAIPSFVASHAQAFGKGTMEILGKLSIAVIGTSGTGSPVIEQLMRLGVGEIVLVDDDCMEQRNVNRILNSTMKDATDQRAKVDVLADAVERAGLGTRVKRLPHSLWKSEVIETVAQCDIVIGCMDSIDGRFLLNKLATFYNIPYIDIGVQLEAWEDGTVWAVCGTIHYLLPGRSSLMTWGVFTMDEVRAAVRRRTNPAAYDQEVKDGYITNVQTDSPAVISVNMLAASLAINELLARLHPYREDPNNKYTAVTFSLQGMELMCKPEKETCKIIGNSVGKGDATPLLNLQGLAKQRIANPPKPKKGASHLFSTFKNWLFKR